MEYPPYYYKHKPVSNSEYEYECSLFKKTVVQITLPF